MAGGIQNYFENLISKEILSFATKRKQIGMYVFTVLRSLKIAKYAALEINLLNKKCHGTAMTRYRPHGKLRPNEAHIF